MDHQAVYLDVLRDVRVADYLGHSILDILDRIAERIGPRLEFAMDLGNGVLTHAMHAHRSGEAVCRCLGHDALVMPDYKDLLDAEFIDSHHQAADDRIKFAGEVVADRADDFGIAALDAHGRLENLRQPRVHAGENRHFLLRQLARGNILFYIVMLAMGHKCLVGSQDFF